jgi:hypothetical protein
MTDTFLNCGIGGWFMLASGVVTFGLLVLAGTALVKYIFFTDRSRVASP